MYMSDSTGSCTSYSQSDMKELVYALFFIDITGRLLEIFRIVFFSVTINWRIVRSTMKVEKGSVTWYTEKVTFRLTAVFSGSGVHPLMYIHCTRWCWYHTLLEIRVLQGFFTNTYNKPYPIGQSTFLKKYALKSYWERMHSFYFKKLLPGYILSKCNQDYNLFIKLNKCYRYPAKMLPFSLIVAIATCLSIKLIKIANY
jgi:hypothetical protein